MKWIMIQFLLFKFSIIIYLFCNSNKLTDFNQIQSYHSNESKVNCISAIRDSRHLCLLTYKFKSKKYIFTKIIIVLWICIDEYDNCNYNKMCNIKWIKNKTILHILIMFLLFKYIIQLQVNKKIILKIAK